MRTFILILFIFSCISCQTNKNQLVFNNPQEHAFYTDNGGFDYIRFPLLMPYEAIAVSGDLFEEWRWMVRVHDTMNFKDWKFTIKKVKNVAVTKEVIMLYSTEDSYLYENHNNHWYVFIPSKHLAKAFATEVEFQEYLKFYGILNISWLDADQAYEEFSETNCLSWIKGCNQQDFNKMEIISIDSQTIYKNMPTSTPKYRLQYDTVR